MEENETGQKWESSRPTARERGKCNGSETNRTKNISHHEQWTTLDW